MKLSVKIFLGICIPSIIAILIVSIILINKNTETVTETETQRSILDFQSIQNEIVEGTNKNIKVEDFIKIISEYYKDKNIYLFYYENVEMIYKTTDAFILNNKDILNVDDNKYKTIIENTNNNYYMYISVKLDNGNVLVYAKNVNSIYEIRNSLMTMCIYLIIIAMFVIAFIAYIISKTITKPMVEIQKEMVKLSKGNYDIHLKENNSELGKLSKNFNKMSKEIKNRNDELLDLINSKQIFIDNLAHEMNTPLTSILGYSELLEKANLTEEQKSKYLQYIQQETKRILDMYKKLLMLSYKKNADFEKNNIDMQKVFNEIKDTLANRLSKNNIELILNNQLSYLQGDETLIIMCISNLIKNAINVSNPESKIMVNAFEMNSKKYIQVVDQGPGISEENIKKILEPFYRVDKVRSRKNGGAGLGLSICKSIMEMHGGDIKIKSDIGKGSIFILEFPDN